jgi:hypothetical protein
VPARELSPTQRRLVSLLHKHGPLRGAQLDRMLPQTDWRSAARSLVRSGVIASEPVLPAPRVRPRVVRTARLACSPEQAQAALEALGRPGSQAAAPPPGGGRGARGPRAPTRPVLAPASEPAPPANARLSVSARAGSSRVTRAYPLSARQRRTMASRSPSLLRGAYTTSGTPLRRSRVMSSRAKSPSRAIWYNLTRCSASSTLKRPEATCSRTAWRSDPGWAAAGGCFMMEPPS